VFSFGGWGRGSGVLSTHRLMPTADLPASTLRIDVFAGFPLTAPPAGPFSPASRCACCERLWPGKGTGEPCQPPLGQVQGCVDVPVYPRLARPTPWHPPVFGIASFGSVELLPTRRALGRGAAGLSLRKRNHIRFWKLVRARTASRTLGR
jgi:hypothetical protein